MVEVVGVLMSLIILSAVVEFVTDVIKKIIPIENIGEVPVPPVISLVVGIAIAVLVQANMFIELGFTVSNNIMAFIITGVVLSAGSKAVHELVSKLRESRNTKGEYNG